VLHHQPSVLGVIISNPTELSYPEFLLVRPTGPVERHVRTYDLTLNDGTLQPDGYDLTGV
jgi:hypothetical protein